MAREPAGVNEVNTPQVTCEGDQIRWSDKHAYLEIPSCKSKITSLEASQELTRLNEVNSTGGAVEVAGWSWYCCLSGRETPHNGAGGIFARTGHVSLVHVILPGYLICKPQTENGHH